MSSETLTMDQTCTARLGLVLSVFALLLAPVGLLASKAVVPLVLVTALIGGLAAGRSALPWRVIDRRLALAIGLFIAWALAAATWSFAPLDSAELALRVGVLLYVLLYLIALAGLLDDAQRLRAARWFAAGFALTVVLLLIELSFRTPLLNLLQGELKSNYATYSRLNRGVSTLTVLVWPLAVFVWQRGHRGLALGLPVILLGVTLFSESATSVVALGAGLLAGALAGLGRRAARLVMVAAVAGAVLASPLIIEKLQESGLAQSERLPDTFRFRMHIWDVVNARIAEKPVFGWGFDTSADLPTGDVQPYRPDRAVIPLHPHNGALQIMVELGLVGSLLTLAILFLAGLRIDRLPPVPRSAAVAMLITLLGIACSAYGIWQSHWLSIIGAAPVIFTLLLPRDGAPRR